ncbi:sialate O-acetylesterase [Pelagicoccus sp. SDUM812005]|uniref:sialate O-acetylesterase n=1 Tax=Pelagicoccus sp. SDUM812005 TaxID=3041257 RepID=UPI0028108119|nr:sialate O-acetylesterase [Pelagicoccus sp. SDUM812005]MDQ8179134.1 sialate O-acetylesterase [Pelagicoccus sp. SDUM812005]
MLPPFQNPQSRSARQQTFLARPCHGIQTLLTLATALLSTLASAAVDCPPIFSDHMVLQRDQPVAIWGTAAPHEAVTVTFADKEAKATASATGDWKLKLPALAASFEPRTLTISGENTIRFEDVLVGEVWLLSGQSNMDKPLGEKRGQKPSLGYPEVLAEGDLPSLRLFRVPNNVKISNPELESNWVPCSPKILDPMQFSAAGFHFGQKLLEELDVPIGLIHSAFGGTMIEAWMPESAFRAHPQLEPLLQRPYFSWIDGVQATELYQSMIEPLAPYTLRGFLWYQGESNLMHGDSSIYALKMQSLIEAWRKRWSALEAPFYFAQLAPFTYSEWIGHKSLTLDALPLFWEAQLSVTYTTKNTGIIPTIDLVRNVRDIHPINKRDVGLRFAKQALSDTYHLAQFTQVMPTLQSVRKGAKNTLVLEFSKALEASRTIEPGELGSFEIAGPDCLYRTAKATWKDGYVELSHPGIPTPTYARYAWDEKASPPKTRDELPLYPFRTDEKSLYTLAPPFFKAKRFDLSPENGRNDNQKANWTEWNVSDANSARLDAEGLSISLSALSQSPLQGNWNKAGLATGAQLVSDGVASAKGDPLKLSISGLPNGRHSIATYHNAPGSDSYAELTISHDGRAVGKVSPSLQAEKDEDSSTFYYEFDITNNDPIELVFTPTDTNADKGVMLNAFAIDVPNPQTRASNPYPSDGDIHADLDAKSITLHWQAAPHSISFHVYLYESDSRQEAYKLVSQAGRSSRSYLGQTAESSYTVELPESNSLRHYAWRVDSVSEDGIITRGEVWTFAPRQLAFPGAEGYGRYARGGRGGKVFHVTNLNDSGEGSLRAAIEASGPRTVVFDVSGRIELKSKLTIRNPFITIAGQTSPGKGICISHYNLGLLGTNDVVLRYLRVRPGDASGMTMDGMGMASSDHSIIDHCSISWTQDEAFSSRGARNITLQRTLISEALNIAGHKKYAAGKKHGYAASIGGDIGSFHHNLLAHNEGRNWSLAGALDQASRHAGRLDIRNNVVYNWGGRTTDGGAKQVQYVNNYYKPGPASRVFHLLKPQRDLVAAFGSQDYFVEGNIMEGYVKAPKNRKGILTKEYEPQRNYLSDKPFFPAYVETQNAAEAYGNVLADVGCNLPQLDEHDQRIIRETRSGTFTYRGSKSGDPGLPDSQEDVGGWEDYPEIHRPRDWDTDRDGMPNHWEIENGLDPYTPDGHLLEPQGSGYTNLEIYLNDQTQK